MADHEFISPLTDKLTEENFRKLLSPKKLTMEQAIDVFGDIKVQKKFWEKLEGYCKEVLGSLLPDDVEEGDFDSDVYTLSVALKSRSTLDGDAVKEELGEDWCKKHMKTTEYKELRLARKPPKPTNNFD